MQIALKPASKTLGLHGVLIRGKGLKYAISDNAFERLQVDAPDARWHCSERNDGKQALGLGHDASLE